MIDQNRQWMQHGSADLYATCNSADAVAQAAAYEILWGYLYRAALHIVYDQPDCEAVAQDCAQLALIRVHENLSQCMDPAAFHAWSRRIVTNVAIDELRRRKHLVPIAEDDDPDDTAIHAGAVTGFATVALESIDRVKLRALLERAPISARSLRVVVGRYFDNLSDEILAQTESTLSGQPVRPSHVQVTRTKDIARLRVWEPLRTFLKA